MVILFAFDQRFVPKLRPSSFIPNLACIRGYPPTTILNCKGLNPAIPKKVLPIRQATDDATYGPTIKSRSIDASSA